MAFENLDVDYSTRGLFAENKDFVQLQPNMEKVPAPTPATPQANAELSMQAECTGQFLQELKGVVPKGDGAGYLGESCMQALSELGSALGTPSYGANFTHDPSLQAQFQMKPGGFF